MGFLSDLLKREARKVISNVVSSAADGVIDTFANTEEKSQQTQAAKSSPVQTAKPTAASVSSATDNIDEEHCGADESVVNHRIEKVAAEEWAGYELRKNIPASEMGAADGARPYSYGLYLNGTPKAMILVMWDPTGYRKKNTRLSHEACQAKGVYCMNLMLHLPNRRSYISEMLRKNVAK